MARYVEDPFSALIQDTGSGAHDLDELRCLFNALLKEGRTIEELIQLVMKSFGLTRVEATRLVNEALGLEKLDDEPGL